MSLNATHFAPAAPRRFEDARLSETRREHGVARLDRNGVPAGLLVVAALCLVGGECCASGFYRNGAGAGSLGMAGADVASAKDPLGAMGVNPAGLGWAEGPVMEWGLTGARADGTYGNRIDDAGGLTQRYGLVPEGAWVSPIGSTGLVLGVGLIPEALLNAEWRYTDPPGGLGGAASYGTQRHRAQIGVVRAAGGLGMRLGQRLSVGGSLGAVYNRNHLDAPYTFQSQPALKGAKTHLDLATEGVGVDGTVGLLLEVTSTFKLGLAYTTKSEVESDGRATGDVTPQLVALGEPFASAPGAFRYDASVINHFPQRVSLGASWQVTPKLRLAGQLDWMEWSDAFEQLEVRLQGGNNAAINGLVGSTAAVDLVPLRWEDALVGRLGVEWTATPAWTVRAGFAHGKSPVPEATLTPLTAAIMESTVAVGLGYRVGRYGFQVAYQHDLPVTRTVGSSELLSGEYSGSRMEVGIHWVSIGMTIRLGRAAGSTADR